MARNVKQRLVHAHDIKVAVWHNVERVKHLVEHPAMLPRDANHNLELIGAAL